jgi:hypothetical protein
LLPEQARLRVLALLAAMIAQSALAAPDWCGAGDE